MNVCDINVLISSHLLTYKEVNVPVSQYIKLFL